MPAATSAALLLAVAVLVLVLVTLLLLLVLLERQLEGTVNIRYNQGYIDDWLQCSSAKLTLGKWCHILLKLASHNS